MCAAAADSACPCANVFDPSNPFASNFFFFFDFFFLQQTRAGLTNARQRMWSSGGRCCSRWFQGCRVGMAGKIVLVCMGALILFRVNLARFDIALVAELEVSPYPESVESPVGHPFSSSTFVCRFSCRYFRSPCCWLKRLLLLLFRKPKVIVLLTCRPASFLLCGGSVRY